MFLFMKDLLQLMEKKSMGILSKVPVPYMLLEDKAKSYCAMLNVVNKKMVPLLTIEKWEELALDIDGLNNNKKTNNNNNNNNKNENNNEAVNQLQISDASAFLHEIGSIMIWESGGKSTQMNAQNDSSKFVILDPSWMTVIFAQVVSAKHFGAGSITSGGILCHKDLPFIFPTSKFDPQLYPFFLEILESCGLVYTLRNKAAFDNIMDLGPRKKTLNAYTDPAVYGNIGYSLIPCLMQTDEPPVLVISRIWDPTQVQLQHSRIYNCSILPSVIGFLNKFIVKTLHSDWSVRLFWKDGAIFTKGLAKLRVRQENKKLEVDIRIRESQKLGKFLDDINTLIFDWIPGIPEIQIACIACFSRGDTNPHYFSFEECEKAVLNGEMYITCEKNSCRCSIRLNELVPDLTFSTPHIQLIQNFELKRGQKLGEGGFADVYIGSFKESEVAIKLLKMPNSENSTPHDMSHAEILSEARREIWLMSGLIHPNIIRLIGVCQHPLSIVMERATHGDLYAFIHAEDSPQSSTDFWQRALLAKDICEGMHFLHSQKPPVIHRDLKSPNILLSFNTKEEERMMCKIGDFGLSRGLEWSVQLEGKVVDNPVWLAPEILLLQNYTEKVDVYSFGVIFWELVTGKEFFGEIGFFSDMEKMIIEGKRPPIAQNIPATISNIISDAWKQKDSERPAFNDIISELNFTLELLEPKNGTPDPYQFEKHRSLIQITNTDLDDTFNAKFFSNDNRNHNNKNNNNVINIHDDEKERRKSMWDHEENANLYPTISTAQFGLSTLEHMDANKLSPRSRELFFFNTIGAESDTEGNVSRPHYDLPSKISNTPLSPRSSNWQESDNSRIEGRTKKNSFSSRIRPIVQSRSNNSRCGSAPSLNHTSPREMPIESEQESPRIESNLSSPRTPRLPSVPRNATENVPIEASIESNNDVLQRKSVSSFFEKKNATQLSPRTVLSNNAENNKPSLSQSHGSFSIPLEVSKNNNSNPTNNNLQEKTSYPNDSPRTKFAAQSLIEAESLSPRSLDERGTRYGVQLAGASNAKNEGIKPIPRRPSFPSTPKRTPTDPSEPLPKSKSGMMSRIGLGKK